MGWSTEMRRVYGRNGRQWWGLILKMSPEGEQPLQLWATGTIIINNSNILSAIGKKFICAQQKKKQTFVDFPIVNLFHFFMQHNSWLSFLTRLTQLCFVKCCWARCSSTSTCCAHVQTPTRSVHAYSSLSCSPSQSQVQYACAETCARCHGWQHCFGPSESSWSRGDDDHVGCRAGALCSIQWCLQRSSSHVYMQCCKCTSALALCAIFCKSGCLSTVLRTTFG